MTGRQLLLLRHAKSAWPVGIGDLDRPLGPRGERDARTMGAFLARNALLPDFVFVSPALRTAETARRVLATAGCDVAAVTHRELYDGDAHQALREVPEGARRALIVGHEPELLELLHTLCGVEARLPTAALAVIELEAPWSLQPGGRAVLQTLVTPKLLADAGWTTV